MLLGNQIELSGLFYSDVIVNAQMNTEKTNKMKYKHKQKDIVVFHISSERERNLQIGLLSIKIWSNLHFPRAKLTKVIINFLSESSTSHKLDFFGS